MTKKKKNDIQILKFIKTCASGLTFAQHFSLCRKTSICGIKSASLHKISLFAVSDLLFYLFELHTFPSPSYPACRSCRVPSEVLQLAVARAVLHYMRPMQPVSRNLDVYRYSNWIVYSMYYISHCLQMEISNFIVMYSGSNFEPK